MINIFTSSTELLEIQFIMYDKFLYKIEKNEISDKRLEQEDFRNKIIELDKQCIITGDDVEICQACHIIPLCDSKSYDINNGILLNYSLHKMFDEYKFGFQFIKNIDNKYDLYRIILSENIKTKSSYNNYKIYDNKEIKIRKGCRKNLKQKYNDFIIK